MVKIIRSIIIKAPLDKVFNYLSNPDSLLEWHPNITHVRNITGKKERAQWTWDYKMMGISFTGKARVIGYLEYDNIRMETTGEIESSWIFNFRSQAGGTRLNFEIDYTIPLPVLERVNELLIIQRNERVIEMALANIKERMED